MYEKYVFLTNEKSYGIYEDCIFYESNVMLSVWYCYNEIICNAFL